MKRTSFLFATITALVLFSCSPDNLTSQEDVSYPQAQALQKISPVETINATGTKCVPCGSMSVSNVPYGMAAWSSDAVCDFRSLPTNARNVNLQFTGSGPSGSGSFSTDYIYIECGNYYGYFNTLSIANIYTTAFAGLPANTKCYTQFYGRCNGIAIGGGTCSLSLNVSACVNYEY